MEPRQGKQAPPIHTYLDTIYWPFYFDVNEPGFIRSRFFKMRNFNDTAFCFQAVTSSDTSVTIELLRVPMNPDKPPDDGYLLGVYITLLGICAETEYRIMDSDYVSVDYKISDMEKNHSYYKNEWALRCGVKMKEGTFLNYNLRHQQEKLLQVMENNPSCGQVSKEKIRAMASLLKRKSINKIFTGRQSYSFAINKCILIERTLRYAEEISKKFEAKKRNASYVQKHQPLNYLFYIYCEKDGNINVREAADLYVLAHYYGLEYLQVECSEFMLKSLRCESFFDVLLVADSVNDQDLMDKLAEIYVDFHEGIENTTQHYKMFNSENDLIKESALQSLITKCIIIEKQLFTAGPWPGRSKPPQIIVPDKSTGRKCRNKRHGKGVKA